MKFWDERLGFKVGIKVGMKGWDERLGWKVGMKGWDERLGWKFEMRGWDERLGWKWRKQFTSIKGLNSSIEDVLCGVPQGSLLGPILFLILINDLPNATKLFTIIFADDTK